MKRYAKQWILGIAIVLGQVCLISLLVYWWNTPPGDGTNLFTIDEPVPVVTFSVRNAAGQLLWRIAAKRSVVIDSIHYGEIPDGFEQIFPPGGKKPRHFIEGEELVLNVETPTSFFKHSGVATGVRRFEGGYFESGPVSIRANGVVHERAAIKGYGHTGNIW